MKYRVTKTVTQTLIVESVKAVVRDGATAQRIEQFAKNVGYTTSVDAELVDGEYVFVVRAVRSTFKIEVIFVVRELSLLEQLEELLYNQDNFSEKDLTYKQ